MKYYTYGFDGLTIPRKSDAPKYERPPGADERDLREAEEKRRRRAEKARHDEERRVVGQNVAMEGMAKR